MPCPNCNTCVCAQTGPPLVVSGTYSWGDLVRMDVVAAPSSAWLAFYGPSTLRVRAQPYVQVGSVAKKGLCKG